MAVTVDATGSADVNFSTGTGSPTITLNYTNLTTTSAATAIVVVACWSTSPSGTQPASVTVTWDPTGANQAFTAIPNTTVQMSTGNSKSQVTLYGLASPSTFGNKTIRITWTNTNNGYVDAISFAGTDLSNPFVNGGNNSNTNTGPTITITSPSGNYTLSGEVNDVGTVSSGPNGTSLFVDSSGANGNAYSNYIAGAGSTTLNATINASDPWIVGGTSIQPPTASNPFKIFNELPKSVTWYQHWEQWHQQTPNVLSYPLGRNRDWPNPQNPFIDYVSKYRSWELRNSQITPTVKTTVNNYDWPLPNPGPQRLIDYTWIESGNSILPTATVLTNFRQSDWPNPRNPFTEYYSSYKSWEWRNTQITPTIKTTVNNYDFPNPSSINWDRFWFNPVIKPIVGRPFINYDFPNPQPISWYRDWSNLGPLLQPLFMYIPPEWDIGGYVPRADQFWAYNFAILQGPPAKPFNQTDWPNPAPSNWYKSWEYFYNFITPTVGIPRSPYFTGIQYPLGRDYSNIQATSLPLTAIIQIPFNQLDWPNPNRLQWYEDLYQALAIFMSEAPPANKPFSQYDWPLPKGVGTIDQSWIQALAALFPPAPPVVVTLPTGRSYTESELKEYWTKRFVEHTKQQHLVVPPSISSHMAKLGRLSGIARRK